MVLWLQCGCPRRVWEVRMEVRWESETENVMSHHEGLNVRGSEWEATGEEGGWTRLDLHFGQMTVL